MFKPFHLFLAILIGWACNLSAQPVNFESLREQYLQSSDKWPKPFLDPGIAHNEIGLLPEITFPKSNPFSVAKMRLGEALFHDPILSSSKHIACASCHDRDLGWADGREVSFGHNRRFGKRNAPSIENAALWENLFWDGRASSLEQQALMPIQDSNEMNFSLFELALRLNINANYKSKFNDVFGKDIVEVSDVAKALATFQRTIRSRNSDFDYFMHAIAEEDEEKKTFYAKQLSDQALWGMHLFRTKARCMNCHSGALFSDNEFHNIGLTYYKREYEDLGLFNITGMPDDVGKFKTPSLRGVMNTKPWMHNGLFASMEGVINLYNAGGVRIPKDKNDVFFPETSSILQPLSLTAEEMKALEAFLNAITAHPARGPHFSFLSQSK